MAAPVCAETAETVRGEVELFQAVALEQRPWEARQILCCETELLQHRRDFVAIRLYSAPRAGQCTVVQHIQAPRLASNRFLSAHGNTCGSSSSLDLEAFRTTVADEERLISIPIAGRGGRLA